LIAKNSPHRLERTPPAGFIEKVDYDMSQETNSLADFSLQILPSRGLK
jgi:hypothetical protein